MLLYCWIKVEQPVCDQWKQVCWVYCTLRVSTRVSLNYCSRPPHVLLGKQSYLMWTVTAWPCSLHENYLRPASRAWAAWPYLCKIKIIDIESSDVYNKASLIYYISRWQDGGSLLGGRSAFWNNCRLVGNQLASRTWNEWALLLVILSISYWSRSQDPAQQCSLTRYEVEARSSHYFILLFTCSRSVQAEGEGCVFGLL